MSRVATNRDSPERFHPNRTQEVAGSSPASSMKDLQKQVFRFPQPRETTVTSTVVKFPIVRPRYLVPPEVWDPSKLWDRMEWEAANKRYNVE